MTNIIFDFDGTLYDSLEGIYDAYSLSCNKIGCLAIDKSSFARHVGPPIFYIAQKLHPELSIDELNNFVDGFRKFYDRYFYTKSFPYQCVEQLLASLRESVEINSINIVTNKPTLPTRQLLAEYKLSSYFDKVIGIDYLQTINYGDCFQSKTAAILYLKSLFSGNDSPYFYVGDTSSDQNAAMESDCRFIAVSYGYYDWSQSQTKPLLIANSIKELTTIFTSLRINSITSK